MVKLGVLIHNMVAIRKLCSSYVKFQMKCDKRIQMD